MYIKYRMANLSARYGSGLYERESHPPIIANPATTMLLCVDSGDRYEIGSAQNTKLVPKYNNFVINKNQNLIQGKFSRIGVTEIRFPYHIPNVNTRNNTLWVNKNGAGWTVITITEGFYTGAQLATALTTAINVVGLTVAYTASGQFTFTYVGVAPTYSLAIASLNPTLSTLTQRQTKRSLMDLIGLPSLLENPIVFNDIKALAGTTSPADLKYTDYIDICSNQLTNYQTAKDMTTQNFTPRSALIWRMYIENESSVNSPTNVMGTFPFTIYRQEATPKMIKWNNDSSVGQIDIQLYDMYGDPLYIPLIQISDDPLLFQEQALPDFQITFLCSED